MANGVRHTEKINSYIKKIKQKKKFGSSHKVIFFISKKSGMINKFTRKINQFFFLIPYTIYSTWLYL